MRLAPAWTTDWISAGARARLSRIRHRPAGGAPRRAGRRSTALAPSRAPAAVACPRCGSARTARAVALRLHALQGAIPLRGVPGAVRLLQAALSKFHSAQGRAGRARDARCGRADLRRARRSSGEAFRFVQGQHLTLRADIDGEDLRRSYSICSAVQDRALRIAVKKAPGGAFSTWVNEHVKPGQSSRSCRRWGISTWRSIRASADTISALPPAAASRRCCRSSRRRWRPSRSSRFTLFYGNRSSAAVMFREELSDLKDSYLERFNLVYVMSREPQDIAILNGRIDAAEGGVSARALGRPDRDRHRVRVRPGRHDAGGVESAAGARRGQVAHQDRALRRQHPASHEHKASAAAVPGRTETMP